MTVGKFKPFDVKGKVSSDKLDELLRDSARRGVFCLHDWVYFRYGSATKLHRVCRKCRKSQSHNEVVTKNCGFWITDK